MNINKIKFLKFNNKLICFCNITNNNIFYPFLKKQTVKLNPTVTYDFEYELLNNLPTHNFILIFYTIEYIIEDCFDFGTKAIIMSKTFSIGDTICPKTNYEMELKETHEKILCFLKTKIDNNKAIWLTDSIIIFAKQIKLNLQELCETVYKIENKHIELFDKIIKNFILQDGQSPNSLLAFHYGEKQQNSLNLKKPSTTNENLLKTSNGLKFAIHYTNNIIEEHTYYKIFTSHVCIIETIFHQQTMEKLFFNNVIEAIYRKNPIITYIAYKPMDTENVKKIIKMYKTNIKIHYKKYMLVNNLNQYEKWISLCNNKLFSDLKKKITKNITMLITIPIEEIRIIIRADIFQNLLKHCKYITSFYVYLISTYKTVVFYNVSLFYKKNVTSNFYKLLYILTKKNSNISIANKTITLNDEILKFWQNRTPFQIIYSTYFEMFTPTQLIENKIRILFMKECNKNFPFAENIAEASLYTIIKLKIEISNRIEIKIGGSKHSENGPMLNIVTERGLYNTQDTAIHNKTYDINGLQSSILFNIPIRNNLHNTQLSFTFQK